MRSAPLGLAAVALVVGCSHPGHAPQSLHRGRRPNIYAHAGVNRLAEAVKGDPPRVYVPNSGSDTVSVIDPAQMKVVDTFRTGRQPQHVVPSYDLRTMWVNNNGGSLTPINPQTGHPGPSVPVADPYNMYFTPDGRSMIIVAEARQELDFRDPHTLVLQDSRRLPCPGINHLDFSARGDYFLASCEFSGKLVEVDTRTQRLLGSLDLGGPGISQPQDVRLNPAGNAFYVADMMQDGIHVITGRPLATVGFIPTGTGAHGIYPSRDGRRMYVTNRGSHSVNGARHGPGSISVIDPANGRFGRLVENWMVPGGGSPDMGNVNADGSRFWVSGRFDAEVYCFDTATGHLLRRIPVGDGPHGLTVWPQPGRYSLGHTGNMR